MANEYTQIIAKRKEEMKRIRAQQDAEEATANEVRDRVGEAKWNQIIETEQLAARKRGQVLDFYRDSNGTAQYRFRKETDTEADERISDWVEDNI